jgi:hypothetical protein
VESWLDAVRPQPHAPRLVTRLTSPLATSLIPHRPPQRPPQSQPYSVTDQPCIERQFSNASMRKSKGQKVFFLTGAPRYRPQDRQQCRRTLATLEPAFERFLNGHGDRPIGQLNSSSASLNLPSWRVVNTGPLEIESTVEEGHNLSRQQAPTHVTPPLISRNQDGELEDDFLEHSFEIFSSSVADVMLHEDDNASPHLSNVTRQDIGRLSISYLTETTVISNREHIQLPLEVPDLRQLPTADYILSINPQTFTIDLVVGIMSKSPARTVNVRRSSRTMDIVELLVGDESKIGFGIAFWLQSTSNRSTKEPFRAALEGLRLGDLVLIRNVALTTFRGAVHGQSLNPRMCRNETTIDLLQRDEEQLVDLDGLDETLKKFERVSHWLHSFLAGGLKRSAKTRTTTTHAVDLPPDSQESEFV